MYKGDSKKRNFPGRNYGIHLRTRSKTMQILHQNNRRAAEIGVSSEEKDFNCSVKVTAEAPSRSFEFYVWSDEGISLCIDLNSSTSDWTNRYRNEVCVSENVNTKESRSLLRDVRCLGGSSAQGKSSFLWNTNSGHFDDCNGQTKSSPSLNLSKDVTGLDQLNKGSCASIYDSLTPCAVTTEVEQNVNENQSNVSAELTVNVADNLKKYESTVLAEVSDGAPNNYISGAESCVKDVYKKVLGSNATKTKYDSAGNSLSSPDTLRHQNSKPGHEVFNDFAVLNGSGPVNPGILCPGDLLSGSLHKFLKLQVVINMHHFPSVKMTDSWI